MEIHGKTITEIYPELLSRLLHKGRKVKSRGMEVREIPNCTLVIYDPTRPLVLQKERKLNYAYAVLEPFLLTMPQTYAVTEACCFYVGKFLNEHVVDKKTGKMFGFYGDKINWNGRNQLLEIFEILKNDPGSRRAILTIHDSKEELFNDGSSLDVPCTLEIHFMIREGKLDCFVNMRGNDAMLGAPQNVPMWTFFQRMLATWLCVEPGIYTHHVNSMHLYQRDVDKAKKIIQNQNELVEKYNFPIEWEISNPIKSLIMCEKFVENERSQRFEGKNRHPMPSFLSRLASKIITPQTKKNRAKIIKERGNPYANL